MAHIFNIYLGETCYVVHVVQIALLDIINYHRYNSPIYYITSARKVKGGRF